MRLAKVLGGVGRLLIWAGSIILLFVAYQLWGTNLAEARAQGSLESDFEALLEAPAMTPGVDEPDGTGSDTTSSSSTSTTAPATPPPLPEEGDAVARILIPAIDVDKIVVEGVTRSDLQKGPGHYPESPLPGQPGNAAIAGHRTTYGAPFHRVDELVTGDEIQVTTQQGAFTYRVTGQQIVSPSEVSVLDDFGDNRLTLTSCHPKFSARQRIVITAELVEEPAPAPPPPDDPVEQSAPPAFESIDGEESRTAGPAVLWGAVTFAVWLLFYALGRKWRPWPAYLLGAPVFLASLFVFFGAFSELLPSNF